MAAPPTELCTTASSTLEAGVRFPTEQCEAALAGLIASLEAMPTFAWLQPRSRRA